jgi:putative ABC transport system ATP-binding protein
MRKETVEGAVGEPLSKPGPVVEARGATKIYRTAATEVVAMEDVDLALERGEMVAVMGPSGCGKTTLLNCLSGLDDLTSGEVLVEGDALHRMSDARRTQLRATRMGFVFQAFNLLPVFSAVENVELPMLLAGARSSDARRGAVEALTAVGLGERVDHRPAELSGGEQQRVAIARAIAPQPVVLWADEPTGNLDTETAAKIVALLQRLNEVMGLTIVVVTHDAEIGRRAARKVGMRDGRISEEG